MVSRHKGVGRTILTEGKQMDAATPACAPSGVAWDGISWADVQRQVRRLQARIVKWTQAGKHNKVKALQWLLTHSFSGRALAVKRVAENKGKNTPGVDKETWKTSRAKTTAIASLKRRGYSALPLRRVLIPKKNGKMRALGIPVMRCRAMQALHLLALEPVAETTADPNSYGFRPERSTADAGEQCFIALARKTSAQWVLEADIKACYDEISHAWMVANFPTDKVILQKWLKAGYVYQDELFPTDAGVPQGGIISPVVANMTLDGLEAMLRKKFPAAKRTGLKMHMVRYADDFIITGNSKEWLEHEVKPAVVAFLAERGLVLSPVKTKVTHIDEGFDFLGWNIRKYNGKLLMKPSKANVKAHLDKIREVIKGNKTAKQANLIRLLNPILRGWANYHRHAVAKETFARVDTYVWSMLWQWAVRRHPEKGARWVKDKYFKTQGWEKEEARPAESGGHADTAACQDQGRGQSARPTVGTILRDPMGQEDDEPAKGPREALPGLAEAGWPVSDLSGTARHRYPLGHPLHCEKNRRWVARSGQYSTAPSRLSWNSKVRRK